MGEEGSHGEAGSKNSRTKSDAKIYIYIKEERKTYSWKTSENYDRDTEKGVTNT